MRDNFWVWLAWRLPRRLAYWCAIRVVAEATTGALKDEIAPSVLAMDCLNAWTK